MKKTSIKFIATLLALVMLLCAVLTSCGYVSDIPTGTETEAPTESTGMWQPPDDEYSLPCEEGYKQLTIYWTYPNLDIATSDIWMWWDGKDGSGYLFHECEYGAKVVVNVPENITEVGFIVRRDCSDPGGSSWGSATKDFSDDRFAILDGKETFIWLKPGDGAQYTSNDGKNAN